MGFTHTKGFPSGAEVKNLPANAGSRRDRGLIPDSGRSPVVRKWQSTPVAWKILAWKIPRTEELVSYSPRGHKELDITE